MNDSQPREPNPMSEDPGRDRTRIWVGIGVPALVAGAIAAMLGIPVWIVLVVLAIVALLIVFNG